jgi:hypothetical protein
MTLIRLSDECNRTDCYQVWEHAQWPVNAESKLRTQSWLFGHCLARAPFPESIVSLSGSVVRRMSIVRFSHRFPKASLVTNVVKTLVANEDSRGTRRRLRASSVASPADIPCIGCVLLKHIQYHGIPSCHNFATKKSGYCRYITHTVRFKQQR